MARLSTFFGQLELSNPKSTDIPELLVLLKAEDLDVRRLCLTSQDAYTSLGRRKLETTWEADLQLCRTFVKEGKLSEQSYLDILRQIEGISRHQLIPLEGEEVSDPFQMAAVEYGYDELELQASQLEHILILKKEDQVIASIRALNVEGNWELVSIVTRPQYRGHGIARLMIKEALERFPQRPLFSFQQPGLIPFYLNAYAVGQPEVPLFTDLPLALQRDLFYMNVFWGTNLIIRVPT